MSFWWFKLLLALYMLVAAHINAAFDPSHQPESRPNLAEVCWFEDESAIWIALVDPIDSDMEVCDEGAFALGYRELSNTD